MNVTAKHINSLKRMMPRIAEALSTIDFKSWTTNRLWIKEYPCPSVSASCRRRRGLLTCSLIIVLLIQTSCEDFVIVPAPSNTINSDNVYNNDGTAIAAVTNIYSNMSVSSVSSGGITSLSLFPALSADELSLFGGSSNTSAYYYYTNSLTSQNLNNPDFWTAFYTTIFATNAAIEGLQTSTGLTTGVKKQLTGEALFMRAFCYFYLVNLYGDVPLTTTTDYKVNAQLVRTPADEVYQQIIDDLKTARELLSAVYVDATLLAPTSERVRPTTWAASALLARVYLYTEKWAEAETEATLIINNSALYDTVALNSVFLKNNKEGIWQLQPVAAGWNTETARTFILPASGPDANNRPFYLSPWVLNSFEVGDKRKTAWTKTITVGANAYTHSFKYKSATFNDPVTEYETVFRLGEQYLIRAEARARQNDIAGAQSDLNKIRKRAGLPETTANTDAALITAIQQERQVELFTEWGHRWLDLKRTGNIDAVMNVVTPQKGGSWNSNWQWYPISRNELQLNTRLTQNDGY